SCVDAAHHNDLRPSNLSVFHIEPILLPNTANALPSSGDVVATAIDRPDAFQTAGKGWTPLTVGMPCLQERVEILAVPGINCASKVLETSGDVDVLGRHRLLREAHGFEGFRRIGETLPVDDLALAEGVQLRVSLVHLKAAFAATGLTE